MGVGRDAQGARGAPVHGVHGVHGCGMMRGMTPRVGDEVHVPGLGTGIVREIRNRGRFLVEIKGRAMVVDGTRLETAAAKSRTRSVAPPRSLTGDECAEPSSRSIDLHGQTVDQAVDALDRFLNEALLAGCTEARVIHGRSGGRIKAAVHARLRELPAVRHFHVDAQNAGVTIVVF